MNEDWINIEGELVSLSDTPKLLKELNLMQIFLRRYFEKKYIKDISPSREDQIQYQKEFMRSERILDNNDLESWLDKNNKTESEMNKILYDSLCLEIFKKNQFNPKVERVFLDRKTGLDRVSYSMIRVKSKSKASELYIRLQEEEATFAELATSYSEGVENLLNGLIGPIEFSKINSHIAGRLKNSSPGQLWPPFELENWWVIIRPERFFQATLNEQMRSRLIDEMYEIWMKAKIVKIMNDLDNNSKTEMDRKV
tara:strand:+ start:132 stop:893 length:762 start_codon:yes stop_codon:yes gene_type:complete